MPEASLIGGKIVGLIHELILHIVSIQTLHELEASLLNVGVASQAGASFHSDASRIGSKIVRDSQTT